MVQTPVVQNPFNNLPFMQSIYDSTGCFDESNEVDTACERDEEQVEHLVGTYFRHFAGVGCPFVIEGGIGHCTALVEVLLPVLVGVHGGGFGVVNADKGRVERGGRCRRSVGMEVWAKG